MARFNMVVIGPARGGFMPPRCITAEVGTVEAALLLAGRQAADKGDATRCDGGPGPVAFLNGDAAHVNGPHSPALRDGDALTVIYPSTDT